jgi:hypothetical protein
MRLLFTGVVFLASLTLQVRVAYACQEMGGAIQEVCCCEEAAVNGCPMGDNCADEQVDSDPCCDLTVATKDDRALSAVDAAVPTDKVFAKTSFSAFLHSDPWQLGSLQSRGPSSSASADADSRYGPPVYLLTQRFRE